MDAETREKRRKLIVGIAMVAWLAVLLVSLNWKYEQGDFKKALELMHQPAGASWTVGQELVKRAGNVEPSCEYRMISSFAGTLELVCVAGPGAPYRFGADLVRHLLTANDERTRALMNDVAAENARRSDGGR